MSAVFRGLLRGTLLMDPTGLRLLVGNSAELKLWKYVDLSEIDVTHVRHVRKGRRYMRPSMNMFATHLTFWRATVQIHLDLPDVGLKLVCQHFRHLRNPKST
jgi:hypothetical protein